MKRRFLGFASVGLLGFLLQITALACLSAVGCSVVVATVIAVELAVIHNFWWHQRLTWRDRTTRAIGAQGTAGDSQSRWRAALSRLIRFQATSGLTSIASNVVLTTGLAHVFGLGVVVANAGAVIITSLANFVLADHFVFVKSPAGAQEADVERRGHRPSTEPSASVTRRAEPWREAHTISMVALAACAFWLTAPVAASAGPAGDTIAAWNAYVSNAEAELAVRPPAPCPLGREPDGQTHAVPGGTIHRWRGCTVVPDFTVDALVQALKQPGTPPPQEDILESRVLARTPDSLRVYLKLKRDAVLTVTYDTEHEVRFARRSHDTATSTSVATSITETGGSDRGFLWRLNSYWRYVQVGPDVRVELESLSLSRSVPLVLRPVAAPIVSRVARESVTRALVALAGYAKTN